MLLYGNNWGTNLPLSAMDQMVSLYDRGIRAGIQGKSEQFLYPVEEYLKYAPEFKKAMASVGYRLLNKLVETAGLKFEPHDVENLGIDFLSLYGFMSSELFVGVDTEAEGMPRAGLFTTSPDPYFLMNNQGLELDQAAAEKTYKTFNGTRIKRTLEEGKLSLLRLDFPNVSMTYTEHVHKGQSIPVKLTMPRDLIDIKDTKYIFIPLTAYKVFEENYVGIIKDNPHWFEKESVNGDTKHAVTTDESMLLKIYSYSGAAMGDLAVLAKEKLEVINSPVLRASIARYNPITGRFPLYNLNSPASETGVVTFRPEMLNKVTPITSMEGIPTFMHIVDTEYLRGIFRTKVSAANTGNLDVLLGALGLEGFANKEDKVNAATSWSERTSSANLFTLMKSQPDIFGDVVDALRKRERVQPRDVKNLDKELPIEGKSTDEIKKIIADAMANGAVRIEYTRKDGSTTKVITSSNPKVLAKKLGPSYIQKYESPRGRLTAYIEKLKTLEVDKTYSRDAIEGSLVEYRVDSHIPAEQVNSIPWKKDGAKGSVIQGMMSAYATAAIENLKSRAMNPNVFSCRNLYATSERDYFASISFDRMIAAFVQEV